MRTLTKFITAATVAVAGASGANAAVVYLDFEGIAPYPNASNVLIQSYYDGGTASNGAVGPNLGVQFTTDALLLCMNTAAASCSNTSRGGLGISASAFGALYFPSANPIMNVAAGFDTGFAFTFSAPFTAGTTVSIYDGLNGTGILLNSLLLGTTPQGDQACDQVIAQGADYCPFVAYSLAFNGIARSVVFGGSVNQQVFDDITFGAVVPGGAVPEPASWAMLIAGFGLVGAAARRRRSTVVAA